VLRPTPGAQATADDGELESGAPKKKAHLEWALGLMPLEDGFRGSGAVTLICGGALTIWRRIPRLRKQVQLPTHLFDGTNKRCEVNARSFVSGHADFFQHAVHLFDSFMAAMPVVTRCHKSNIASNLTIAYSSNVSTLITYSEEPLAFNQ
jgi:hypothetical protein